MEEISRAQLLVNLHRAAHSISDIDVFTARLLLQAATYIEKHTREDDDDEAEETN